MLDWERRPNFVFLHLTHQWSLFTSSVPSSSKMKSSWTHTSLVFRDSTYYVLQKNVGLLNLQLLRSFFHTFCYQKKRPCLPPPRPGPSLRSQSKPGRKRRHPTRPALRRCGGGVSGHCGELHRSMHHQPTFGDSGRCPKCGEKSSRDCRKILGPLEKSVKITKNKLKWLMFGDFLRILWFSKCMFWLIPLVLMLMDYWLDWVIGSETLIGIDGIEGININPWHPNQPKVCALGHVLVFAGSMFLSTSPLVFFQ